MLHGIHIASAGFTGLFQIVTIIGRVAFYGAYNIASPVLLKTGTFALKSIPAVLYTGTTWAVTNSAVRFFAAFAAASGFAHMYLNSNSSDKKSKDISWNGYRDEIQLIIGALASLQIYSTALLKSLYNSADPTFFYLPSKIIALSGTGFNWAYESIRGQYLTYISNPLKIMDMGAWIVAKGGIWATEKIRNRAMAKSQSIQDYAEIYGYTDITAFKKVENIKNGLLWIEKFNLDKEKLFADFEIQKELHQVLEHTTNSFNNFYQARTFANFKAILGSIIKYPKVLTLITLAGLSASNEGIFSVFSVVTGLPSLNTFSGIRWSGPSIVKILNKPLILLSNYIPIIQPVLTYAIIFTSETTLAYGSIALSISSLAISMITIIHTAIDLRKLNNNIYENAIATDRQRLELFYKAMMIKKIENNKGENLPFHKYVSKDVYAVAVEFLKFKEKDRTDYIGAFAIKLLKAIDKDNDEERKLTPKTKLIISLKIMELVMTTRIRGETSPPFIKNKEALNNYIFQVLTKLLGFQIPQQNINSVKPRNPDSSYAAAPDYTLLNKDEQDYLNNLKGLDGTDSFANNSYRLLIKFKEREELNKDSQAPEIA